MAAKPLTTEAIALTEKKMDMSLDDIIKMSKTTTTKTKKQRIPNKNKKFLNNADVNKSEKAKLFNDSRSSLRQAAFAQRRSTFPGNHFPLAADAARKSVAPIRNRYFNRNRAINVNKPRVGAPPVQRKAVNGGYSVKPLQQPKMVPKQRPQTLDALFANLKEERMRVLSQQQNNSRRRNGGDQQRQQRVGRGRFGY